MMLLLAISSCKKEYVTNEYITNEYVTNEYVYNKEYYSTVLAMQTEVGEDIRPPYLKKGDTVAICVTSNAVSESEMADGIAKLESWGLNVVGADNLYLKDGRYAGTLSQRIESFQKLIDNPNIKAIIAARGGYGAAQILGMIDFKPLINNPKWMVGFSDITAIHIALNNLGIESLHGPMANNLKDEKSVDYLKKALFGELDGYSMDSNSNCINGVAKGRLVGGNLSLIYSLGGTLFDLNAKGAILFIEEVGESNYSFDRMLTNLKLSGKLDYVKGIIIGELSGMNQGIDKSVEEIVKEKVEDLGIPVFYGFPAGHDTENFSLYFGRNIEMEVTDNQCKITFE